jgi:hypothetical protein
VAAALQINVYSLQAKILVCASIFSLSHAALSFPARPEVLSSAFLFAECETVPPPRVRCVIICKGCWWSDDWLPFAMRSISNRKSMHQKESTNYNKTKVGDSFVYII